MDAAAHNQAFAQQAGIPQPVAQDFSEASKGMKFGKGPKARPDLQRINKPETRQGKMELFKKGGNTMATKMNPGFMAMMAKKKAAMGGASMAPAAPAAPMGGMGMKKGGMAKETIGPRGMDKDVEKGSNKLTKFGESAVQKKGDTKGRNLGDSGPTVKPQTMRFAKGGSVHARAGGIAKKGFTKGRTI